MSITADREIYALESRSESLELSSFESFVRDGESDMIEVGMGSLVDSVDGDEEATYGTLTVTHDHKLNRLTGAQELEVNGIYNVKGKEEVMMITGAFAETEAGGQFFAGGMSDVLLGGAGCRLTLMGDLWLAGLYGMEEKIATGVADGMLLEVSGLAFEREYVSSNYNGTFAYQNAAITHTTSATGFLPMLKVVRGLRNQLPGSGAPEGEGGEPAPAAPPPAAGGEGGDAAGGADGGVRAGTGAVDSADGGGAAQITRATESASGAGETATSGTRVADASADGTRATDGLLEGVTSVDEAAQGDTAANTNLVRHASESIERADETAEAQNTAVATRWVDDVLDSATESTTEAAGPRYGDDGRCIDPGAYHGMSEDQVSWWKAHFEEEGYKVAWVDGRWSKADAADTAKVASAGSDAAQTASGSRASDAVYGARQPTFKNDICVDDGPYFGQTRAKVEADRVYYERQGALLKWEEGQWHSTGSFETPSFDSKGICVDEGPFHGVPQEDVWASKELFEAEGRRVEWGIKNSVYTWIDNVNIPPPGSVNVDASAPPVSVGGRFKWRRPPFRHPKTARRLKKMSDLSKANKQAALTAAAHKSFNQQVLSGSRVSGAKSAQDQARSTEKMQVAANRLNETVEASSDSSSGNWWKTSEDMRGNDDPAVANDGRHMVEERGDLSHLERMNKALERSQDTAATGADKGVFGVVSPSLTSSHALADIPPTKAPMVGGSDARHLLPTGNAVEQVSAPSVMRAVDGLESQSAAIQRAVVRAEEAAAVQRLKRILNRRIGELKVARQATVEPTKLASISRQITKAENTLATLEASTIGMRKADAASEAGNAKLPTIGEITDTATPGSKAGSENGVAKSTWQASESAPSGESVAGPQINGAGAQWSDGPPKSIEVERTAVVQGSDGTLSVQTDSSGSVYNNDNWLEMLSNSAPPKGASTGAGWKARVPRPSRMQKIRAWFSSKAAQIVQIFRRSGSGAQQVEDASSGGRLVDRATETSAVLDNVPSITADRGSAAAGRAGDSSGAKGWQSGLESGNPGNPGSHDLLHSPPDDTRGLDTNLELVEGNAALKTDGEGSAADSAGTGVKAGRSSAASPGPGSGANYADYMRYNEAQTRIRKKARDFEQDTSLRQIGTINDVRNWYDEHLSRRLVSMAQQVDPSHSKESLIGGESLGRWNLEADIIFDSIYRLNQQAVETGDTAAANGYAEIIRRGAEYLNEVDRVATRRAKASTVAEPAPYRANRVLELIQADADFIAAKEANFAPLEDLPPDLMRVRTERTLEYSAWDIAVNFLRNQEDARAPLYRYMDRANYAQMASDATTDAYGRVIGRLNEYVAQACFEVGVRSPQISREGRIFSLFTEGDKARTLMFFDRVDAAGDLMSPIGRIDRVAVSRPVQNSPNAPTPPPVRVNDAEGVKYGVSPEFPTVTVRGAQTVEAAGDTAPSAKSGLSGIGGSSILPAPRGEEATQLIDIQRDTKRWEAAYESVWDAQRQAAGNNPQSVDSVQKVRDWHSTETANRMVQLVQQVDPAITRGRMVGQEGPTYTKGGKVARGNYKGCTRDAVNRSRASWEANGYEVRWDDADGWAISKAPDGVGAKSNIEPIYQPDDRIAIGRYSGLPRKKIEDSRRAKQNMGYAVEWNHSRGWVQVTQRPPDDAVAPTAAASPSTAVSAASPTSPSGGPRMTLDGKVENGKFAGASYSSVEEARETLVSQGYTVEWDDAAGWRVTGFTRQNALPPAPGGPVYVKDHVATGAFAGTPRGEIEQSRKFLESQGKIVAWDDTRGWVELVPGETITGPRFDSKQLLVDGPFAGTPRADIDLARTRIEANGGTPVWDSSRGWIDTSSKAAQQPPAASPGAGAGATTPGAGTGSTDGPGIGAGSTDPGGPRYEGGKVVNDGGMKGALRDDMDAEYASLVSQGKTPVWNNDVGWVDSAQLASPQPAAHSPGTGMGTNSPDTVIVSATDPGADTVPWNLPPGPEYDESGLVMNKGAKKGAHRDDMDLAMAMIVSQGKEPIWDNDLGWYAKAPGAEGQLSPFGPRIINGKAVSGKYKGMTVAQIDSIRARLVSDGNAVFYDDSRGWVMAVDAPPVEIRDRPHGPPYAADGTVAKGNYRGVHWREVEGARGLLVAAGDEAPRWDDRLGWVKSGDAPPPGPKFNRKGKITEGPLAGTSRKQLEKARKAILKGGNTPVWNSQSGWIAGPKINIKAADKSAFEPASRGGRVIGTAKPQYNALGEIESGVLQGYRQEDVVKLQHELLDRGCDISWNHETGWEGSVRWADAPESRPPAKETAASVETADLAGLEFGPDGKIVNLPGNSLYYNWPKAKFQDWMKIFSALGGSSWDSAAGALVRTGDAEDAWGAYRAEDIQATSDTVPRYGTDGGLAGTDMRGASRREVDSVHRGMSASGQDVVWDDQAAWKFKVPDKEGALYSTDGRIINSRLKGMDRYGYEQVLEAYLATGWPPVWDPEYGIVIKAEAGGETANISTAAGTTAKAGAGPVYDSAGRVVGTAMNGFSKFEVESLKRELDAIAGGTEWHPQHGLVIAKAPASTLELFRPGAGPVYDGHGIVARGTYRGRGWAEIEHMRRSIEGTGVPLEWDDTVGWKFAEDWRQYAGEGVPGPEYNQRGRVSNGEYRTHSVAQVEEMRDEFSAVAGDQAIEWDLDQAWKLATEPEGSGQGTSQSADSVGSPVYDTDGRLTNGGYLNGLSKWEIDRLHEIQMQIQGGVVWEDGAGWRGTGKLIREEDSDRIRLFLVAEHSSAVAVGDTERANNLAYVLRNAAEYMEATKTQSPSLLGGAGKSGANPRSNLLATFNTIDESARQAAARRRQRAADAAANANAVAPTTGPARSRSGQKRRVRFADQPSSAANTAGTSPANSNAPVIYLDFGAGSPAFDNLRGLGQGQVGAANPPSRRRGILSNIVRPRSQTQFSPTQRAAGAGTRPTPAPRAPRIESTSAAAPRTPRGGSRSAAATAPNAASGGNSATGKGGLGRLALFQFETGGLGTRGNGSMAVQDYMKGARK